MNSMDHPRHAAVALDDEDFHELDQDSADRLIEHIRREHDGGTFGSMDGDSAATWIIDRIGHLLEHPEDV